MTMPGPLAGVGPDAQRVESLLGSGPRLLEVRARGEFVALHLEADDLVTEAELS
jgi:hypothetical protein